MKNIEPSTTYKIKPPPGDHAVYFTIVGGASPIAFFINSKEMNSFQWITALMTAYSKQIKAGVNIQDIINEMKDTFDPSSSYFISGGIKVNSVVHHLGLIIENHIKKNTI